MATRRSARFGVADDARDGRKAPAQAVLDRVDQIVHRLHGNVGIDAAVEINDFAVRRLANADVVGFAEAGDVGGKRTQRFANFSDARGCGIAPGKHDCGQRLDMGLDFDLRAKLLADRLSSWLAIS